MHFTGMHQRTQSVWPFIMSCCVHCCFPSAIQLFTAFEAQDLPFTFTALTSSCLDLRTPFIRVCHKCDSTSPLLPCLYVSPSTMCLLQMSEMRQLLFGRQGSGSQLPWPAWKQGFFFCCRPGLSFGLVQQQGGPCGLLAAMQVRRNGCLGLSGSLCPMCLYVHGSLDHAVSNSMA